MKRTPWSLLLVAAAIGSLVPSACSDTITQPAQLPDCMGSVDASCNPPRGSPGSGVTIPDGSMGLDSAITQDLEGGSCGEADMLASSSNAACLQCLLGPDSGSPACCASDAPCSADFGCRAIVSCALLCNGDTACVEKNCEASSTTQSVQNYIAFSNCVAATCPACPSLPQGTPGEN